MTRHEALERLVTSLVDLSARNDLQGI